MVKTPQDLTAIKKALWGDKSDSVYTTGEASQVLGLRPESIARLCRTGAIESMKIWGMWWVPQESLDWYKKITEGKKKTDPTRKIKGQTHEAT